MIKTRRAKIWKGSVSVLLRLRTMWVLIDLSTHASSVRVSLFVGVSARRFFLGASALQHLQREGRLPQHGRQPAREPVCVSRERFRAAMRFALRFPLRLRTSCELFRNLETQRRCCTRTSLLRAASLTMLRIELERLRACPHSSASSPSVFPPSRACECLAAMRSPPRSLAGVLDPI